MTDSKKPDTHSYERDQVVQLISSVITKVEGSEKAVHNAIFKELRALLQIIDTAREELGAARAQDIKDKHIPTATDELDAVVEATAEASGTIMDCCDAIQEQTADLDGEKAEAINQQVFNIYEACSFQDITGQRITKVVSSLKNIEAKVEQLLDTIASKLPGIEDGIVPAEEEEESLVNGPQLPQNAMNQDDIDKLLADFDAGKV